MFFYRPVREESNLLPFFFLLGAKTFRALTLFWSIIAYFPQALIHSVLLFILVIALQVFLMTSLCHYCLFSQLLEHMIQV
jgi:hypothetical protein